MVSLYVFQHFLYNSVHNIIYTNSTSAPASTLIFVHRFLLPFLLPGIQINIE